VRTKLSKIYTGLSTLDTAPKILCTQIYRTKVETYLYARVLVRPANFFEACFSSLVRAAVASLALLATAFHRSSRTHRRQLLALNPQSIQRCFLQRYNNEISSLVRTIDSLPVGTTSLESHCTRISRFLTLANGLYFNRNCLIFAAPRLSK